MVRREYPTWEYRHRKGPTSIPQGLRSQKLPVTGSSHPERHHQDMGARRHITRSPLIDTVDEGTLFKNGLRTSTEDVRNFRSTSFGTIVTRTWGTRMSQSRCTFRGSKWWKWEISSPISTWSRPNSGSTSPTPRDGTSNPSSVNYHLPFQKSERPLEREL